jgi:hypothetical protein
MTDLLKTVNRLTGIAGSGAVEKPYGLEFDHDGNPCVPAQLDNVIDACRRSATTDLIFLAHGFRNNAAEAGALYAELLASLTANLRRPEFADAMKSRVLVPAGIYWPSKEHMEHGDNRESIDLTLAELRQCSLSPERNAALDRAEGLVGAIPGNRPAQDQFVASVLSAAGGDDGDPAEGMQLVRQCPGSELFDRLRSCAPIRRERDEGGIAGIPLVPSVLGEVGTFLNFMSWSAMKTRSGLVGANGVAAAVRACQRALAGVRIHLVGHSLGGRLMAACAKALGMQRGPHIQTLSLLEAAFSHFGFSPDAGSGQPGFFREVVTSQIVEGPLISTFSKNDSVLGKAYTLASRLAQDRLQAIGDASDPYGALGHNGALRTREATVAPLQMAGRVYRFPVSGVLCLDGSAGLINSHGDVTNPHVTYAIASAICAGT